MIRIASIRMLIKGVVLNLLLILLFLPDQQHATWSSWKLRPSRSNAKQNAGMCWSHLATSILEATRFVIDRNLVEVL